MRNNRDLAQKVICDSPRKMGRPPQWAEDMQARFAAGTFDRIAAVAEDGETRTDFVREAVRRELERREKTR